MLRSNKTFGFRLVYFIAKMFLLQKFNCLIYSVLLIFKINNF